MDRHANLIEALVDFYTVLVQLCIIVKPVLRIPDPVSGIDGFYDNYAPLALEAGFSLEVVHLMARLPYLEHWIDGPDPDGFSMEGEPEIMPSTYACAFIKRDNIPSLGSFESMRQMDDDPMDDEYLIPGTCLRLSWQNVYGITWIYDTETCLLREWHSFDRDPDVRGFDWAPTGLPTEILGAWTQKYRKLQFIGYPGFVDFGPDEESQVKERIPEHQLGSWQSTHDFRVAQLKIRDMYLECGWDVESKTQEKFDRKRFVEMRDRFRTEVLTPLEDRMNRCSTNRDCTMEELMRETPEELKQWTAVDNGRGSQEEL